MTSFRLNVDSTSVESSQLQPDRSDSNEFESTLSHLPPIQYTVFCLLLCLHSAAQAAPNFQDDILPIFKEHCLNCHNPDKAKGDLDLTTVTTIQEGGSSGMVVKAGAPDTSYLYMVTNHDEDADPMPPKKARIPQEQIDLLHAWIAGGLIESKGGKSQLRDISFSLEAGASLKPEKPAIPAQLPALAQPQWQHTPPAVAVAASPWADVVAQAANEHIFLYTQTPAKLSDPEFRVVAADHLLAYETFDSESAIGKAAGAITLNDATVPLEALGSDFLQTHSAFTFSTWVKASKDTQRAFLFSNTLFGIFIDPFHQGLTIRSQHRDSGNAIVYHGRKGSIETEKWAHVSVTMDGDEFAFFIDGKEVSREKTPKDRPGFLNREKGFVFGGSDHPGEANFSGQLDDLRIYDRALSAAEIETIYSEAFPTMAQVGSLAFPEGKVHDLKFSPNGDLLIAAGGIGAYSGQVAIYDVATGKLLTTIADEQDTVLSADITPDHQFVAIGTPAKMVKIFSVNDGKLHHRIAKHTDWVTSVRFSPDGKYLASGDRNGGLHTWETKTGGIVYTLNEHKVKISALSWRPDGAMLASAGEDGKFVLWDMKDGWATRTATVHNEKSATRYTRRTGITDITYLKDGSFLTIGRDKVIKTWKPDGSPAHQSTELKNLPLAVTQKWDGTQIYIGDLSGSLHAYHTERLTPVGRLND